MPPTPGYAPAGRQPRWALANPSALTRPTRERWDHDARPEHLRQACEASLRRLRLERIGLYQLHAPDPKVPLADSPGELGRLQREGKIRHVGVSNVSLDELRLARTAGALRLTPEELKRIG